MSGYRELKIYQEAHRLGVAIHRFSLKLPKYEEMATEAQELLNEIDSLGRQLNVFVQSVEARIAN